MSSRIDALTFIAKRLTVHGYKLVETLPKSITAYDSTKPDAHSRIAVMGASVETIDSIKNGDGLQRSSQSIDLYVDVPTRLLAEAEADRFKRAIGLRYAIVTPMLDNIAFQKTVWRINVKYRYI